MLGLGWADTLVELDQGHYWAGACTCMRWLELVLVFGLGRYSGLDCAGDITGSEQVLGLYWVEAWKGVRLGWVSGRLWQKSRQ